MANQNTEELTEEGPVLVTVAEDGTELPVETQMVGEAEGGGVYLIMIKIKRISIAPIYHTRWERRALYSNTNDTTRGWGGGGGIDRAVKKQNLL